MRQLLATFVLTLVSYPILAQDIIVKENGDEIETKVIEITDNDVIKYKNYDHLDGPIRNMRAKEVFMIIYEDGEREILKENTSDKKEEEDGFEDASENKKEETADRETTEKDSLRAEKKKINKRDSTAQSPAESEKEEVTDVEQTETESKEGPVGDPRYKDPYTAQVFGIVLPGGGHFYAGETGNGMLLLGLTITGPLLSDILIGNGYGRKGVFYAGVGVSVISWIYSIVDSKKAARRTNRANGVSLGSKVDINPALLTTRQSQSAYGMSLKFNF